MTRVHPANDATIAAAAARLAAGDLVAFPTETVYGLGADARNDHAVAAVYEAKGRPQFNPLIAHVADLSAAEEIAVFDDRAYALAQAYWPGPLTLVLPKKDQTLSKLATAGLETIGVRVPAHPVAQKLLRAFDGPVVAPSANASGRLSPTSAVHVDQSLGDKAGYILAGGRSAVGLESTIVDVSGETAYLLRAGAVTQDDIENLIGPVTPSLHAEGGDVRAPGQLLQHYAPCTALRLNAVDVAPDEALLAFGSARFMGVRGGGGFARDISGGRYMNLSENGDLTEAAANLFAMLHALDTVGATSIAVMPIPDTGLGVAINDRLRRAAGG